jgi:hypothetical protein
MLFLFHICSSHCLLLCCRKDEFYPGRRTGIPVRGVERLARGWVQYRDAVNTVMKTAVPYCLRQLEHSSQLLNRERRYCSEQSVSQSVDLCVDLQLTSSKVAAENIRPGTCPVPLPACA